MKIILLNPIEIIKMITLYHNDNSLPAQTRELVTNVHNFRPLCSENAVILVVRREKEIRDDSLR